MNASLAPTERRTLLAMRRLLLVILSIGMIGTAADLVLLEHYEDSWQLPPLALIGLAVLAVAAVCISGGPTTIRALRLSMYGFVAGGLTGILLHFIGNSEFQRELDPTLHGWPLVVRVLRAKAPPALAPASMIQLGLIGLLYTYRHPAMHPGTVTTPLERSTR